MMSRRDSRGGSVSIGYLGLIPFIMLLVFGGLQAGMQYTAHAAAVAAARAGADQARLMPAGDGRGAALAVLEQGNLLDPEISIDRGAEEVTVTVSGRSAYVLWNSRVRGQVTYPVERAS